jgi:hypothetical protein
MMGSMEYYLQAEIDKAEAANAPFDVIYFGTATKEKPFSTFREVKSEETLWFFYSRGLKQLRELTVDETVKYQFQPTEMYGLIDTEKDTLFLGADTAIKCVEDLKQMGTGHPRYQFLELVKAAK